MISNIKNHRPCYLLNQFKRVYYLCHEQNLHAGVVLYCTPKKYQGSREGNDIPTVMEVRKRFMKIRGVQHGFRPAEDRSYLLKYLPKTQDELPPRSIKDSFQTAVIPLSSYLELQERYVTETGNVRFGRLMEDLDMFSDWIAMNYVKNPKQPEDSITSYVMVTVLVYHISFSEYIPRSGMDIHISGHVSGVGKTTIETTVWMEQDKQGVYHQITKAVFLMAARNATLSGGAFVNPLVPADEEEKLIIAGGEERKRKRSVVDNGTFPTRMPDAEEQQIIHNLFLESIDTTISRRVLPPNAVWMTDTKRNNNIFSFTEDRNFHNTVFGGFLMRHALEMAWFTGYFHCKHRPRLRNISDIHFKHPVPLGSVIDFYGRVIYTEGNFMQIFVHGDVNDPVEAKNVTSIVFYFTYESPEPIKSVKPNTYYEAMMYVDGRRHFLQFMNRDDKII